jgi:hypothetical protein
MKKTFLLCATLCLFSAPALAQQMPAGGVDRTLGNGNVESQAPGVPNARPRSMVTNPSATGGVDGTLGNGNVESQAGGRGTLSTGSTTMPRSPSPQAGGVDRTLGNGNVESQAPGVGTPTR